MVYQTSLFSENSVGNQISVEYVDLVSVKLKLVKEKGSAYEMGIEGKEISDKKGIVDLVRNIFYGESREIVVCVAFCNSLKPVNVSIVNMGSIDQSIVDLQYIAKFLLLSNANRFALVHNHPGGTLKPSNEDIKITEKIKDAMKLFSISMLDHIIVTPDVDKSFSILND